MAHIDLGVDEKQFPGILGPMRYPATETSPSAVVTSRALLAPVARMRAGSRWFAMTSMRCTGRAVGMTGPASQASPGRVR